MKTKYILFILFLIYSTRGTIKAQDTLLVEPVKIDSLLTLIDQSKEDKEKVRLLNEYARLNFYNQEYKTGLIATVDARELAAKINYSGGDVMYHITVATFLGWRELQAYHLRQARVLSVQNNETDLSFAPTYPKGYPPRRINIIEELLAVLPYFEKSGNKEMEAIILDPIGRGYFLQGKYKKLQILQNKAIKLYTDLNQLYPLFLIHNYRMRLVNQGFVEGDKKQLENELKEVLTRTTDKNELIPFYHQLAGLYSEMGQSDIAMDYYLKSIEFYESSNELIMLNEVYGAMSDMYGNLEMYVQQAEILEKRIAIIKQFDNSENYIWVYRFGVWTMHAAKRYDEAREYMEFAIQNSSPNQRESLMAQKNGLEGQILMDYKKYEEAIPYLIKSYNFYSKIEDAEGWSTTPWEAMHLANCYYGVGDMDEALKFGNIALETQYFGGNNATRLNRKVYLVLYEIYNALEEESLAFKYLKLHHDLVEKAKTKDNANIIMEAEVRSVLVKSEIEITRLEQEKVIKEQQNKAQRLWIFSIAGALLSALLVAFILYRNNKSKQKANAILKEQKEEIQSTLEQLEATQSQLIQAEKMASLGELTAGIAHEIQNPLNFVNNFAEVSSEMIEELIEERSKDKARLPARQGERDQELEEEILNDIVQNLIKINHHGQRASGIVKGMLEHSRTSTGKKELTDINVLADEYLRLAYHGLRAKNKSFNADFKMEFDESLPKINVVSQDIGRVLLNLINNAFYAVTEALATEDKTYKPEVVVRTEKALGIIMISVKDNGKGIPEHIRNKIFQPFFTTKPTGQGTGLGLSLSYDIITKGHGGKLIVETEEGQGTEFKIILPLLFE